MNVKFGRALRVTMTVMGRDSVKTLVLIGHVRNDERVAAGLLKDTNVLTFC